MDEELEDESAKTLQPHPRNAKLKVLVRSHAMREAQSPPREPTSNNNNNNNNGGNGCSSNSSSNGADSPTTSPCTKPPPSPSHSSPVSHTNPVVVLSPSSVSRGNSPYRSHCISPATTLVPSPNARCSPRCLSPQDDAHAQHQRHNRNNNLDRDRELTRNELSSQVKERRRYQCDNTQECTNCVKEKYANNNSTNNNCNNMSTNTLSVARVNSRGKLRQQSSSQGSFESSHTNSPNLSRDSSAEQYTDTTGIDLEIFIPETLNRNAKDRALMLRIEQELVNLAKDKNKTHYKFPPMSSYQRMLVHRCAAYFGMEHNIESSGKCVVVNKTKNTRIPCVGFKEHIKEEIVFGDEPRRSILKRDSNSIEDYNYKSPERHFGFESRRSKSFEEREEEYEKVRKRIFKGQRRDSSSVDDIVHWSDAVPWSSTDSETSTKYRLQLPGGEHQARRQGKLLKVQSEEAGGGCGASDALMMRPHVAKSYSFGGYGGVLNRGDSVISSHSAGPRLLTKQDSAASSVSWRLSPSSSGYKSQSQMSESITPSPTSTPHLMTSSKRQDSMNSEYSSDKHDNPIVWAVTDIDSVPKGSIIINPQTGQPIKNADGSIYHYDPDNVPMSLAPRSKSPLLSPVLKSPPQSSSSPTPPQQQQQHQQPPPPAPHKPPKSSPPAALCTLQLHSSSPKKKSTRCSPLRRMNTTNSATSPSLPYANSPLGLIAKSFTFPPPAAPVAQNEHNVLAHAHQQQQQQQHAFHQGYGAAYGMAQQQQQQQMVEQQPVPIYHQQPCIVYGAAAYGVPMQPHYEGRLTVETPQMAEMAPNYFLNVPENSSTPLLYQQPTSGYWTQQPSINYYQNQSTTQPRYPLVHAQSTGCLSNFMPPQPPSNNELLPVYHNQQMQYIYPNSPPQPNPVVFPAQNSTLLYAPAPPVPNHHAAPFQNSAIYQTSAASHQSLPIYPPNTPTPNSCASSTVSNSYSIRDSPPNSVQNVAQGVAQMNLGGGAYHHQQQQQPQHQQQQGFSSCGKGAMMLPLDGGATTVGRHGGKTTSGGGCRGGGKIGGGGGPKGFALSSSQSSTGNSSPAATVIAAGYCSQGAGMFRTPPETPPTPCAFVPNMNMVFRPMGTVRAPTPGTNRSSRSPTPANEITHFGGQRMTIPPTIYHGMPYVIQHDPRMIAGRGQPTTYRQPTPPRQQSFPQGPENNNRSHNKGRKTKNYKLGGLPPSGKQP